MKLIDILVRELPGRGGWPDGAEYFVQDSDGTAKHGKKIEELSEPDSSYGVWHRGTSSGSDLPVFNLDKSEDWLSSIVTRRKYEAALAATKEPKTTWKYIKGSEKDFVGLSDKCTHITTSRGETYFCHDFDYMSTAIRDSDGVEVKVANPSIHNIIAQREPVAEWDGVGLPPVGCEVEIEDKDGLLIYGHDESGEVIAHVENTAVVRMSYGLGCFESRFLRPLRTEADKKRDAAIEAFDNAQAQLFDQDLTFSEYLFDAIAAGKIPGVKLEG